MALLAHVKGPLIWFSALSNTCCSPVAADLERVIWRAQKASRVDVVGAAAMHFIERREAGRETNEKPFNAEQKGQTMQKYVETSVTAYMAHPPISCRDWCGGKGGGGGGKRKAEPGPERGTKQRHAPQKSGVPIYRTAARGVPTRAGGGVCDSGGGRGGGPGNRRLHDAETTEAAEVDTDALERCVLKFFIALLDDNGDN